MQYSVDINNARLDAVESTTGASPKLRIFSGTAPANCAAADSGTLLCEERRRLIDAEIAWRMQALLEEQDEEQAVLLLLAEM